MIPGNGPEDGPEDESELMSQTDIPVRGVKVVGNDYLLYTEADSLMAYVQIDPPGWVSLGRVGEQGLLVDQSEWPRFSALVAAVSELREARRLSAEAGKIE